MRVLRRPIVEQDLIGHYVYIFQDSPDSAEAFLDAAETTINDLATWPLSGQSVDWMQDRFQGLRKINIRQFSNYLVFYLVGDGVIEVVRVLHGARDLPAALQRTLDDDGP